jgi:hypothetical protein
MIYSGSVISERYVPLFEADARRWRGIVRAWLLAVPHAATISRLAGWTR